MSISSIGGGTAALSFSTQSSQSGHHRHQIDLSNTAQLLGVSSNNLASDLQSGATLGSLASSAGVSSSKLLSSVEADLKANAHQGAPALSDTQLQNMATNLINGAGPGGAGAPSGPSSPPSMTHTAQLLGVSTNQLATDLQSGGTLSSLASAQGISSSDLLSNVEADLKVNAPQGAASLSGTRLADIATNIINGTGPGAPGASAGSSATSQTTGNVNSLASALGIDPQDLLNQIMSGNGLSQLMGAQGQSGYGSAASSAVKGGLIVDQYA